MEEILLNELCSKIPEQRLNKIVNETVKKEKGKFCDFFNQNVQREFPGFRNIRSVPFALLCSKVHKECLENLLVAQTLLEEWYLSKQPLVNKIKEKLEELSYKCKEPDFSSLKISFEYLQEEHSTCIDTLCYANILNHGDDEETLFEITLIAIFLGWFPSKENKMIEERTSSLKTNQSSESSNSIDEMIKQMNFHYDSLQELKSKLNSILIELSNSVKSEKLIRLEDFNLSIVNDYNDSYAKIIEIADKISLWFGDKSFAHFEGMPKPIQLDLDRDTPGKIKQRLFDYYIQYIETLNKMVEEKLSTINDLLSQIELADKVKFEYDLKEIQQKHLSNKSLDSIKEVINQLSEIEVALRNDIESYDLEIALNDFETNNSKRAENYILDFFRANNSTAIDDLIFFLFLLPEKISLSTELKNYILHHFIQFLAELKREQLISYISEDTIHRVIQETEEGKKLLAILAIILYTSNSKELATSIIYKEGIYESVSNFNSIREIVNVISKGQDFKFYNSKINNLKNSEEVLQGYFSKNNDYQELLKGIDNKYRTVFDNKVLTELSNILKQLKVESDLAKKQNIINKITQPGYPKELYQRSKADLPQNFNIEKKLTKLIEKIVEEIKTFYGSLEYEEEFTKNECIPYNNLEVDIKKFFDSCNILKPLERTTLGILLDFKNTPEKLKLNSSHNFENYIASLIIESKFFAKYCCELHIKINERKVSTKEMYQIIKNNFELSPDIKVIIERLKTFHCFKSLELLSDSLEASDLKLIDELKKNDLQEIEQLENFLEDNDKILQDDYFYFKTQGRFKYCKDLLIEQRRLILDEKKKTSEMLAQKFNELQKISAKTRYELTDEKDKFSEHTYGQILNALKVVDEVSYQKKEKQISLAIELLKEIEHLRQFNNESLDQLNNIMLQYSADEVKVDYEELVYLKMPLTDIIKHINNDDYVSLGLTKQQWMEISSDRKEYIIDLIKNWLYLQEKPSTKEDIIKGKFDLQEMENQFSELLKNLFSICSLYKTNDTKRIGQDPMLDWKYSTDLPFIYTSRLQSPRCSSLDKPIRFYVLTKLQTSSKKYIIRIKDFISEKQYDQTGFNVLVLLDNKEKIEKINTYSLTKSLPVLDEYALKRIIFSVSENRLPKWQFVSLLTLNKKISTIQPFKTQGSVDNNTGIFVGRNEIIKEISSSKKDFAIYGGRKIGKSSLLSVISENLLKNDHVISLQSFQGIDNPLTVAKSIIEDLKSGGLKSSSLIPVNSLDDFSFNLLALHRYNESRKVVIILDEMDELIHKERKVGRHQIIEIFRNISHKTNHQWRFIFAGFKEMYLEIHGKGVYEHWKNPWQNFVDDSNMQLSEIESPRELIDEGLKDILGLEYEKDIIDLITKYSTGHPAFLQKFCECLVKSIDNRISLESRRIYKKDVDDVFDKDTEFINFVKGTLDLNLSILQELITVVAAMENKEVFTSDWISSQIKSYTDLFNKMVVVKPEQLELELELLTITGIIKRTTNKNEFRFTHPYYIIILKRLDIIDNNLIENLITKICE